MTECPLREAAARWPDRPAVMGRGLTISYRELDAAAEAAARRLGELGLATGGAVAMMPSPDWRDVATIAGAWRRGLTVCLINTRNPPAVVGLQASLAGCRAVLRVAPGSAFPAGLTASPVEGSGGTARAGGLDGAGTVLFTSGSTGEPRGVVHRLEQLRLAARAAVDRNRLDAAGRWLMSLPLYHAGGLSVPLRCFEAGAALVQAPPDGGLAGAIAELGVTHVSWVATQLKRLLDESGGAARCRTLRCLLLGGGPTPEAVLRRAVEAGLPVCQTYGMTESASQITTVAPDAGRAERETCGRPLAGWDVSLAADGEIRIRGAALARGYLGRDGMAAVAGADGWFATGDLGRRDASGCWVVTGRKDNLFISGGENIQPEEIEMALMTFEGVDAAVVVPIPDPEFGERPAAFVAVSGPLDREDLARRLGAVLPRFKVPVVFWPMPGEAEGGGIKPKRSALKALAALRMGADG